MFKREAQTQSPDRRISHIKTLMFFVVAMFGLSACASESAQTKLDRQMMKSISTPMPMGVQELQTVTVLKNRGCNIPNNYALAHADGPVTSPSYDGTDAEVRGLFTKLYENGIEVPTTLFSENGLAVGYEEYDKTAKVKISKKAYILIQYLLTLLHESIHSCTGTSPINNASIFDFIDESQKVSASLTPRQNETEIKLVLLEGTLGTSTVNEQVIDLEEILTHGLTHALIQDSGLFENTELARDINEKTSAFKKAAQFFDHILNPQDIQTLLEMKSSRDTTGIYSLLYKRFIEKINQTTASSGIQLTLDGNGQLSSNEYLFTKILSIISQENSPYQESEITATLAKLLYNKDVNTVTNDEMNIIQQVMFNLFRA